MKAATARISPLGLGRLLVVAAVSFVALCRYSYAFPASNGSRRQPPTQSKYGRFKHKIADKSAQSKRKGYELRNTRGVRTNRRRPPRWETEGDALFFGTKSDYVHPGLEGETPTELLKNLVALQHQERPSREDKRSKSGGQEVDSGKKKLPENLSWGPISTGPILSPRLKTLYNDPTPIQIESFGPISNKKNVVIAAPTGSGKTLAYLVPLLCRIRRRSFGAAIIVTPTTELAMQIQAVADTLWPPLGGEEESCVYVVKSEEGEELQWIISEMMIEDKSAPIIAGTPLALCNWLELCIKNRQGMDIANGIEAVVLDEADRLLQTEALSRIENNKRNGIVNPQSRRRLEKKTDAIKFLDRISSQGQTFFAGSRERIQVICASATVGRTLRRQIMELTEATSVDMGSELVCADDRVGKDADMRKSSLLPNTIAHTFLLQEDSAGCEGRTLVRRAWDALESLPPGPTIIFPGKTGVKVMVEMLTNECGLQCVKTLQDNIHKSAEVLRDSAIYTDWEDTPIFVIGERFGRGLDIQNIRYVCLTGGAPNSPAAYAHLAGRTGRAGKQGKAITFVKDMKDANRIANISSKLGISFYPLFEDVDRETIKATGEANVEDYTSSKQEQESPSSLSKEDLEACTMPVLKGMLKERGQQVSGRKAELVERLLQG
eukprot:scaffold672_cov126-Cylindrotheca_fusiformis.AAC.53